MGIKKLIKLTTSGFTLGFIGYLLYKNLDLENELQNIRDNLKAKRDRMELNEQTRKLIIREFFEYLFENPDMTLEEVILKFEKADPGMNLETFAKTKMRRGESYVRSYKPYYEEAKRMIN